MTEIRSPQTRSPDIKSIEAAARRLDGHARRTPLLTSSFLTPMSFPCISSYDQILMMASFGREMVDELFWRIQMLVLRSLFAVQQVRKK